MDLPEPGMQRYTPPQESYHGYITKIKKETPNENTMARH